ncbi:hypothetical protein P2H44_18455 [Albimonas sp. CAU 1670]|uniref:dCTP deaminase domain-containing protein n=1 Tax=Albimonas sp. CAU 1670 TaxID=3032599 RepID=UPI0023DC3E15|nr:hypothetical protein [Albimonas sp. CAU 1670]MDF2234547.1 hypothetical protein [Albimonas sp. CAU 1670]
MSFWGRQRWLSEGAKGYRKGPVFPWDEGRVEAAGYRLSVGCEYFINGSGSSTSNKLDRGRSFVIQPGQFAYILTDERVYISKSAIGFISIRASLKFLGLVNVSGFQVNPGYSGNLIFAVFNAGPKHINIRHGDEIFSIWIADLDAEVPHSFTETGKIPNDLDHISSDIVNGIAGEALTAYQLTERISELRDELQKVRTYAMTAAAVLTIVAGIAGGYYFPKYQTDTSAPPSAQQPTADERE